MVMHSGAATGGGESAPVLEKFLSPSLCFFDFEKNDHFFQFFHQKWLFLPKNCMTSGVASPHSWDLATPLVMQNMNKQNEHLPNFRIVSVL
jgi:hypothetical protein